MAGATAEYDERIGSQYRRTKNIQRGLQVYKYVHLILLTILK